MKYKEIHIIRDILQFLKPANCLEWGSGYSTLYFPRIINNRSLRWLSVEHDGAWANMIKTINPLPNVEIAHVPSGPEKGAGANTYEDFKSYVEYPDSGKKFDFILVDGRARKYCVKKAFDLVHDRGVVLLHDANRKEYRDYLHLFPHQELFDDIHQNRFGLWIGARTTPVDQMIDLKKHRRVWDFHYKVGKLLGTR